MTGLKRLISSSSSAAAPILYDPAADDEMRVQIQTNTAEIGATWISPLETDGKLKQSLAFLKSSFGSRKSVIPRDWQVYVADLAYQLSLTKEYNFMILQLPTGVGKSIMIALLAELARPSFERILIITTNEFLANYA